MLSGGIRSAQKDTTQGSGTNTASLRNRSQQQQQEKKMKRKKSEEGQGQASGSSQTTSTKPKRPLRMNPFAFGARRKKQHDEARKKAEAHALPTPTAAPNNVPSPQDQTAQDNSASCDSGHGGGGADHSISQSSASVATSFFSVGELLKSRDRVSTPMDHDASRSVGSRERSFEPAPRVGATSGSGAAVPTRGRTATVGSIQRMRRLEQGMSQASSIPGPQHQNSGGAWSGFDTAESLNFSALLQSSLDASTILGGSHNHVEQQQQQQPGGSRYPGPSNRVIGSLSPKQRPAQSFNSHYQHVMAQPIPGQQLSDNIYASVSSLGRSSQGNLASPGPGGSSQHHATGVAGSLKARAKTHCQQPQLRRAGSGSR